MNTLSTCRSSKRYSSACGLLLGVLAASPAHADFALKAGDRVVFYGDSITEQRLYTTFVETFVVTRFPKMPISFVGSGWGGERVNWSGGGSVDLRLARDVVAFKPTVVTVMLGMNDGAYRAFDQNTQNTYASGMTHILDSLRKSDPNIRFTLIQPSPYDDVTRAPNFEGGYNAVLNRFGDFLKTTAQERNLGLADLNTPVVSMLRKANATDTNLAQKIIPDRIHPGPAGHLIMAGALLKAWDAPAIVSDIALDATAKKVVRQTGARVADFNGLSWTQTDEALPFPIDTGDAALNLAVKSSDFVESLNRETLQVTGLAAPRYTLSIDGEEVGDFSREELAAGVNLATLPTPMRDQAQAVHRLTIKHNNQRFERWRNIQVPLESHSERVKNALPPLLTALEAEEAETVAQQRALAQPKTHRFELSIAQPEPTGVNLALGKPYTASDPNVYGYGTGGLTDGSWSGDQPHTFASGEVDTFPKTATIDLGAVNNISAVKIGVPSFGSTKTVKVSVSEDGQFFREVGNQTFGLAVERKRVFRFAPQNARFVRLTFPDHYAENAGYTPTFVFISEVEVYGTEGK